jgi:hypothetical protein
MRPNQAFERTGLRAARARVRHTESLRPAARLKHLRPAAHAERQIADWRVSP